jgi:hypothetical protein
VDYIVFIIAIVFIDLTIPLPDTLMAGLKPMAMLVKSLAIIIED